jgi:uncharacterized membrane protein|nr:hypothetical protein [Candidatus Kapabacteria bacterium]HOV92336.1 hypothetical protein [Candidatus Kapabacteria bacterium]
MKTNYLFWGTLLIFYGLFLLLFELNVYFFIGISWVIIAAILLIILGLYFIFQKNKIAKMILIIALSLAISFAAFKLTENIIHPTYSHQVIINYQ